MLRLRTPREQQQSKVSGTMGLSGTRVMEQPAGVPHVLLRLIYLKLIPFILTMLAVNPVHVSSRRLAAPAGSGVVSTPAVHDEERMLLRLAAALSDPARYCDACAMLESIAITAAQTPSGWTTQKQVPPSHCT